MEHLIVASYKTPRGAEATRLQLFDLHLKDSSFIENTLVLIPKPDGHILVNKSETFGQESNSQLLNTINTFLLLSRRFTISNLPATPYCAGLAEIGLDEKTLDGIAELVKKNQSSLIIFPNKTYYASIEKTLEDSGAEILRVPIKSENEKQMMQTYLKANESSPCNH